MAELIHCSMKGRCADVLSERSPTKIVACFVMGSLQAAPANAKITRVKSARRQARMRRRCGAEKGRDICLQVKYTRRTIGSKSKSINGCSNDNTVFPFSSAYLVVWFVAVYGSFS